MRRIVFKKRHRTHAKGLDLITFLNNVYELIVRAVTNNKKFMIIAIVEGADESVNAFWSPELNFKDYEDLIDYMSRQINSENQEEQPITV